MREKERERERERETETETETERQRERDRDREAYRRTAMLVDRRAGWQADKLLSIQTDCKFIDRVQRP